VYRKLSEQTQKDREQGAEKLKAALDAVKDEREQKLAKVVSRKDLPKEPINYKARILYSHSRTHRLLPPAQRKNRLLCKISKETHEAHLLRTRGPTSNPQFKLTEVTEAPRGLIEEHKFMALHNQKFIKPAAPKAPIPPRPSKAPLAVTMREKPVFDKSLKEREDRLRALTGAAPSKTTTAPDLSRKVTNNQSARSKISPGMPKPTTSLFPQITSNAKRTISQRDGPAAAEAVDDTPPVKRNKIVSTNRTSNPTRAAASNSPQQAANSPSQQRSGTPATLSRFDSPKRKAEPSVFMTAKRPKNLR
jgi:hypothetical protein